MSKKEAIELFCTGNKDKAYSMFKSMLDQKVEDADIYCHLGMINESKGQLDKAVKYYNEALKIDPDLIPALANLGNQLKSSGYLSAAYKNFSKAIQNSSKNSLLYSNFANVLVSMAEHKKAYQMYLKALSLNPNGITPYSNFLLSLNYKNIYSDQEIFSFHHKFSDLLNEKKTSRTGYDHKKLRIGYVSADFKTHSVAYFIKGILHFHDRGKFDIFCYSDVPKPDLITEEIAGMDLTFKNVSSLSNNDLHQLIIEDEIDILVDLGGHTAKRLQVFSQRSAPVQLSYLGYGNTTGLKNMDYRIVDKVTDQADSLTSEELIRLNRAFIAFCPPEPIIEIEDTPALTNNYITFGSFNNLPKLSDEVLRLWMRILKKVPSSKIMLKTKAFNDENIKSNLLKKFNARGIDSERVELLGFQTNPVNHLLNYKKIDIALDPFPYNGTTTTCEALHMSVPLICLKGKSHISRVSASLLEHSGLQSLVAKDKNEYLKIAVELAGDPVLLNKFHHTIRNVMHSSQICDSKNLTEELEKVYLQKAKRPA